MADTPAAAAAAAAGKLLANIAVSLYIFYGDGLPPSETSVRLPPGEPLVSDLRMPVSDAAFKLLSGEFTRRTLTRGKLYVTSEPVLPPGEPPKPNVSVAIDDETCILLDLAGEPRPPTACTAPPRPALPVPHPAPRSPARLRTPPSRPRPALCRHACCCCPCCCCGRHHFCCCCCRCLSCHGW
jgi:hypothetical protein